MSGTDFFFFSVCRGGSAVFPLSGNRPEDGKGVKHGAL